MSTYRFARLPSASSVATAVTLAVCGWLTLAGAAIVTESPAPEASVAAAPAPVAQPVVAVALQPVAQPVSIAPEARLTIVVEARRA